MNENKYEIENNEKWFEEYQQKSAAYRYAMSTLSYECSTFAPKKSIPYTQQMMGVLAKELIALENNPFTLEKILEMDVSGFQPLNKESILKHRKNVLLELKVPLSVKERYYQIQPKSEAAWIKAKQQQDFSLFAPHLKAMIDWTKERVAHLPGETLYDKVLAEREEGTSIAMYDRLFDEIKQSVVPLLKRISEQPTPDQQVLKTHVPQSVQEAFLNELQRIYRFDQEAGMMKASAHPFCSGIAIQNVRFTTKYDEEQPMFAVSSMMHEVGHALYEQQSDLALNGTFLNDKSAAMHEGQSRFYENMVGNTESFLKALYPMIQKAFTGYEALSFETFYRALNVVKPSFIRIEADELTYPLHIMIRYELEKKIFNEGLDVMECPRVWNELTKAYLGLDVENDAQGILQDIHFSWGYFGYFPTYVLGSAYAAQFDHYLRQAVDMDQALATLDLGEINQWMKAHIHQYAGRKTNDELFIGMGEEFNPKYYCEYLVRKFTNLYKLS